MTNIFLIFFTGLFVMLNLFIKMLIDFLKQKGDLGINSGLPTLANSFGELGEMYSSLEWSVMHVYAMDQYQS